MEKIAVNYVPLYSLGYVHAKVPTDVFEDLNNQVNLILKNNFEKSIPFNNNLYGAIEKEFSLPNKEKISSFVLELSKHFWLFQHNLINANKEHTLQETWINFQKKYEHNPLHTHDGDLSFVVWVKIPYDINDEKSISSVKNSKDFQTETAGFTFMYPSIKPGNNICKYPITMTKQREGEIILFESSLAHMVYPFYTSDDYRISISGNLNIE